MRGREVELEETGTAGDGRTAGCRTATGGFFFVRAYGEARPGTYYVVCMDSQFGSGMGVVESGTAEAAHQTLQSDQTELQRARLFNHSHLDILRVQYRDMSTTT